MTLKSTTAILMKITHCRQTLPLAAALLAVCASSPLPAAQVLVDPLDDSGAWQLGGGSNSTNRSLEPDTLTFNEGTASLVLVADYLAGGFAYTDMNLPLNPSYDFSQNTFHLDTLNATPGVSIRWTLGTTANTFFSAFFDPTPDGTWHTTSLTAGDFGASPEDLFFVNFIQLQVIGDGVSPLPATVALHFDNLRIIPEPGAAALLGLAALALALQRRRGNG